MTEWFKVPVLKTGDGANRPWVQIPLSPPLLNVRILQHSIEPWV